MTCEAEEQAERSLSSGSGIVRQVTPSAHAIDRERWGATLAWRRVSSRRKCYTLRASGVVSDASTPRPRPLEDESPEVGPDLRGTRQAE